jgi:hypothetical protein
LDLQFLPRVRISVRVWAAVGQTGVVHIETGIRQALLRAALSDGTNLLLVVLEDGRCAILRDGTPVHTADGDADGIDDAVQLFLRLSRVPQPQTGA